MSSCVTSVAFADAALQPIACSRAPIHTKKFLGLVALLLCCHLTNALISEHLLAGARIFKFPIFFTCFQCSGYVFIAFFTRMLLRSERRRTPLRTYAFMGALQAVTLASSTLSMRYLNFPTVLVFKSSKLLPVMAMNAVMLRRRQKPLDIAAALLLCLGLVFFSISDSKSHPEFRPYGVLLVLCSLCADACICNVQEATMQSCHSPVLEMVLFSHAFALLFLLPAAAVAGEMAAGVWWLSLHPGALCLMVLFCICGFLGVSSVFSIVESFGCVAAVAATTFRKAITMLISFLVFPKPFTIMYLYGSGLFLAGIVCSTVSKQPGACPRVAALFQRLLFSDRAAARKTCDADDCTEAPAAHATQSVGSSFSTEHSSTGRSSSSFEARL